MLESHINSVQNQGVDTDLPEFEEGLEWFNSYPLSFKKDLKGKIVVLYFWTYSSIHSLHSLPDLAFLEQKYADQPIVFISIHSPKFTNEHTSENVKNALLRHDISHPVVNDVSLSMWKALGVSAWPTFTIIGPKGNLLLSVTGEEARDTLDSYIASVLNYYNKEEFANERLPTYQPTKIVQNSPLNYPSKLAIDDEGHRLFIADSNNNRILIVSEEGVFLDVIGSGKRGFEDGSYQQARFYHPQGIAYSKNILYIADTDNHAVRKVDLSTKIVTTLVGTGKQGRDYCGALKGKDQELSSPRDLVIDNSHERLLIAMTGTHQIWTYDLNTGQARPFSGSGVEQNLNSPNLLEANWSQPSGLSIHEKTLFIADSNSSALRSIDLKEGHTQTLVGGDPARPYSLFSFGDVDGSETQARLQYPMALLWLPKEQFVVVADTYNHKLKILDPIRKTLHTWIGNGQPGYQDGDRTIAQFSEPSGLALSSDEKFIYVADTNNHAIRKVTIVDGEVHTINLKDIPKPQPAPLQHFQKITKTPPHTTLQMPPVRMIPNSQGVFRLEITTPAGFHLEKEAPSIWQIVPQKDMPIVVDPVHASGTLEEGKPVFIPFVFEPLDKKTAIQIEVLASYCHSTKAGCCYVDGVLFDIPMEVGNESPNIPLKYSLKDHPQ